MTETRVWLCRHAETATPLVFHGAESDEVLSPLGRQQALAAAEWFCDKTIDVVVSSIMRRAVETARPVARACGRSIHTEEQLHERRVGALCGTSFSLSAGPWVETLEHWTAGHTAFTTPGAESYNDLVARLLPAWQRIIEQHQGRRIVVVCHGIVVKVLLLTVLKGWGPSRWHELGRVANLAVSEITASSPNEWTAVSLLSVPPVVMQVNENAAASAVGKSEA